MRHQKSIRQADDQPSSIQATDLCRGLHDRCRNEDANAGDPERHLATEVLGGKPGGRRGDESAQDHERGDELLPFGVDVPPEGRIRGSLSKYLDTTC